MPARTDSPLDIAIIGAGLGGLSAAVALRRQGHRITVYERYDFAGEVGASLSAASNGSRFLEEWGVDVPAAKPVILKKLIMHDWETGEVKHEYGLGDYKAKFGTEYNNFHRIDIHQQLLKSAFEGPGAGLPCTLKVNHRAVSLDAEAGTITFDNGESTTADLIIAADGIRVRPLPSQSRPQIGITPTFTPSTSCCYRCIIHADKLRSLGLEDFISNEAIEYWGGFGIDKIVLSPCSNGEVVSCYCFYPAEYNDLREDGWNIEASPAQLLATFPRLDARMRLLMRHAEDIKMWRLYKHEPYPYWTRGKVCLLGDAAHPMMPDQSQGSCMAFEDAGALGLIFHRAFAEEYSVAEGLRLYERLRKPRATRVQEASFRAREDLNERIGWSSGRSSSGAVERNGKLTIEEVCGYNMREDLARLRQ
ncbi:salicylate hydroxylase [Aspergillus saccharolyticus JOP 1030-1]|uniref:Salicylate hydroxylase n=1 Tax=Aspergillus saccharolyticus JOP 1030-1 TaxID=1450539 RepID=A0A318ZNM6_9EURO|nr:salicylate hydroxylase [Aspergillus saccharolyticus JOP 1030-1]PYH46053.1 salicylate hydroxylase [Aspergillus saccharolyticus JOP 1030-1]